MTWQQKYSVNIPELDVHHKHLFRLISELNDAMICGKGNDVLGHILDDLIDYTKFHFQAEEKIMLGMRFPGVAAHIREHDYMLARISQFKQEYLEGKSVVSVRLLGFLRTWLQKHILSSDKKYSTFSSQS